jgi:hypothetical protein
MNNAESPAKSKTLAEQLSEGRLPVQDGLRYAALLAEALRKIHDDGRAHGGVTPDVVAVDGAGLELMPASPAAPRVTPYTAPEVAAQNRPADARSDIFSFGTIVYEMLTGRRAFVGEPEAVLIASLCNSAAAPTGSPAVDRLVNGCLAKDPAARWQRMQKIILELKLLTAAARRTATAPVVRRDPAAEAALRAEMQQIESRLSARLQAHADATAQTQQAIANNLRSEFAGTGDQMAVRLQAHEQSAAQIHQSVLQAVNDLRGQFAGSHDQLAARLQSQEQSNAQVHQSVGEALNGLRGEFTGAGNQLVTRLQSHEQTSAQAQQAMHESVATLKAQLEAMSGQLAAAQEKMNQPVAIPELAHLNEQIAGVHDRIGKVEQAVSAGTGSAAVEASLEAIKKQMTELHTNVAADMHEFELNMKAQANAIESARTAMAQTDDLVERVVEALESLQSTVLDHADERAMALN